MEIIRLVVPPLDANCYLVANDGECVIIDAGGDAEKIEREMKVRKLTARAVFLTHGHFDHISAAKHFQQQGIPVYIGERDSEMTFTGKNLAGMCGLKIPPFNVDEFLRDGDKLNVAGLTVVCLATPGHSEGGMCFKVERNLFTGDTLFCCGIGRTDFPGGSYMQLINSIGEKLLTLDGDYCVYPGHGETTTLDFERKNNPYIVGDSL